MTGSPGTRLSPDLPPGPRSALVIATTTYQDPELRHLRAPAEDARDLADVLVDPTIGGFTVTPVIDAAEGPSRRAIDAFLSSRDVGEVVVVYVSCHGLLDRRNRLYYAATDTIKTQLSSTAIPSVWLLEQLDECRSRQQVLILDCCFSGAFAHGSKGDADVALEQRLTEHGRGRVTLTASRAGEFSFEGEAVAGRELVGSVFTAGLVEGLRSGAADTGGDGFVSVIEAYKYAERFVLSSGANQTPQHNIEAGEGDIVLARSAAGIIVTPAALPEDLVASLESRFSQVRVGAVHALNEWLTGEDPARVMAAEQTLQQIAEKDNPVVVAAARAALANIPDSTQSSSRALGPDLDDDSSGKVAKTVPKRLSDRAARCINHAEMIAQLITEPEGKASALIKVAKAVTATDPDRADRLLDDAEMIAQLITEPERKASALIMVAKARAAIDPDRADRLLDDAETIGESITEPDTRALKLILVAEARAATRPERAARQLGFAVSIATRMTDEDGKSSMLSDIAMAALTDLDLAEYITDLITDEKWKSETLRVIAKAAVAAAEPDRAERIARSITDEEQSSWALGGVAQSLAATDPDRAESIARSIPTDTAKTKALCDVATIMMRRNPKRGARLLRGVEPNYAQPITDEEQRSWALLYCVEALTPIDFRRAESIAQSITKPEKKALALSEVAKAVVTTNPLVAAELLDEVERIAEKITKRMAMRAKIVPSGLLPSAIMGAIALIDSDNTDGMADESYAYRIDGDSDVRFIARAVAATDPDRAERIVAKITSENEKALALSQIAKVLAATDGDSAERIAESIPHAEWKVVSLLTIATESFPDAELKMTSPLIQ
jgi:hypothetical protein